MPPYSTATYTLLKEVRWVQ